GRRQPVQVRRPPARWRAGAGCGTWRLRGCGTPDASSVVPWAPVPAGEPAGTAKPTSSVAGGRACAAVADRGRTGHRSDGGGLVDIQGDRVLEHQRPVDPGIRTDDHPRVAPLERDQLRARLLVVDAAAHVRTDADREVTVDGRDAAGHVGVDQADGPVGGLDVVAHVAAAVDEGAAVDGGDVDADRPLAAGLDARVDRREAAYARPVGDLDAAVDGFRVAGGGVLAHPDAAVDGVEIAGLLPVLHVDAAIDLAVVLAKRRGRHRENGGEGEWKKRGGGGV